MSMKFEFSRQKGFDDARLPLGRVGRGSHRRGRRTGLDLHAAAVAATGRHLLQVGGAPAGVGLGAVCEGLRRRQELRRLEAVLEPRLERLASRVRGGAVVS